MMFESIKNDIEKRMASTTQSFKSDMQGIRACSYTLHIRLK